jgi:hypothetical protein
MNEIQTLTVGLITAFALSAAGAPQKKYQFQFKVSKQHSISITKSASTKEEAYKLAAKDCFHKLTAGKYPGEERGLDIIDICANPKM